MEADPAWQRCLDVIEDEEALCDLESPVNNRYVQCGAVRQATFLASYLLLWRLLLATSAAKVC